MITLEEVASRLHVSRATLYRWSREGRLALYKLGPRATRIRLEDLARLQEDAAAVHQAVPLEEELWEQARACDSVRALATWDGDLPSLELRDYHRELSTLGSPVRWNEQTGEFEELEG